MQRGVDEEDLPDISRVLGDNYFSRPEEVVDAREPSAKNARAKARSFIQGRFALRELIERSPNLLGRGS